MLSAVRSKFKPVILHCNARQKYVLIEVVDTKTDEKCYLVRGNKLKEYHDQVAEETLNELTKVKAEELKDITFSVLGGGRIEHMDDGNSKKEIEIYGYSTGFPWSNDIPLHTIAQSVVQQCQSFKDFVVTVDEDMSRY